MEITQGCINLQQKNRCNNLEATLHKTEHILLVNPQIIANVMQTAYSFIEKFII